MWLEFGYLLRSYLQSVVPNAIEISFEICNLSMLGYIGKGNLAAAGVGSAIFMALFVFLEGTFSAADELLHKFAVIKKDPAACRYALFTATTCTGAICVLFSALMSCSWIFVPVVFSINQHLYIKVSQWVLLSIPTMWVMAAYRLLEKFLFGYHGITKPVLVCSCIGLLVNMLGNYIGIHMLGLGFICCPVVAFGARCCSLYLLSQYVKLMLTDDFNRIAEEGVTYFADQHPCVVWTVESAFFFSRGFCSTIGEFTQLLQHYLAVCFRCAGMRVEAVGYLPRCKRLFQGNVKKKRKVGPSSSDSFEDNEVVNGDVELQAVVEKNVPKTGANKGIDRDDENDRTPLLEGPVFAAVSIGREDSSLSVSPSQAPQLSSNDRNSKGCLLNLLIPWMHQESQSCNNEAFAKYDFLQDAHNRSVDTGSFDHKSKGKFLSISSPLPLPESESASSRFNENKGGFQQHVRLFCLSLLSSSTIHYFVLAIPSAFNMIFENWGLGVVPVAIASYMGSIPLDSTIVMLVLTRLCYTCICIPLSFAATTRIAMALESASKDRAWKCAVVVCSIGVVGSSLYGLLLYGIGTYLGDIFTYEVLVGFRIWKISHLLTALQVCIALTECCKGILRAMHRQRQLTLFQFCFVYAFGYGLAYFLAYNNSQPLYLEGLWVGILIGYCSISLFLVLFITILVDWERESKRAAIRLVSQEMGSYHAFCMPRLGGLSSSVGGYPFPRVDLYHRADSIDLEMEFEFDEIGEDEDGYIANDRT